MLLFTQSLGTLDLIERALKTKFPELWPTPWRSGYDYFRLDGTTGSLERKQMVQRFNRENSRPNLFLISVKVSPTYCLSQSGLVNETMCFSRP